MSLVQAQALFVGNNTLRCGGQRLAPWVRSGPARACLGLPGTDVQVNPEGACTPASVYSMRQSYIAAILIHSRGYVPSSGACTSCSQLDEDPGRKPFLRCRHRPGHFNGACSNCKWPDHAARCSVRDGGPGGSSSESSSSSDESSSSSSDDAGEQEEEGDEEQPESSSGSDGGPENEEAEVDSFASFPSGDDESMASGS